ncbi:AAA family ATPase [Agarivorans sp. B2Z047]|uniref:AAA family ATPase n=1 Tax=Agarivorans sp. B2Z047 TaxID=2652721 RepID=UPI00188328D2|nr:AAA family ATPase [Agarivorans sp. B2Z047]UQN43764.1 AAA family ATPase [Agarivorans sp. B2Z047]
MGAEKHRVQFPGEADIAQPSLYDIWRVDGCFEEHPEHGIQFVANEARRLPVAAGAPQDMVCEHITHSPYFAGLDSFWGQKLNTYFSNSLVDALSTSNHIDLSNKAGLAMPISLAKSLLKGWNKLLQEEELRAYLIKKQLTAVSATCLTTFWGNRAIEHLEKNPYWLLCFMHTPEPSPEQWKQLDKVIRKAYSIRQSDNRRVCSAIEYILHMTYERSGNTALPMTYVEKSLREIGINSDTLSALEDESNLSLEVSSYSGFIQSKGLNAIETSLSSKLMQQATSKAEITIKFDENLLSAFESVEGVALTAKQRQAVEYSIESELPIIDGPSKSGKTTILRAIAYQLTAQGFRALVLPPLEGNKNNLGILVEHGSPKDKGASYFPPNNDKKQEQTTLLIDDASLLDIWMLFRLLKELPKNVKLCFFGDSRKLPPPGPGLIFHQLYCNSHGNKTFKLESLRPPPLSLFSDALLQPNAQTALSSLVKKYQSEPLSPVSLISIEPVALSEQSEQSALSAWYEFYRKGESATIIVESKSAQDRINREIQSVISNKKQLKYSRSQEHSLLAGDPVIFTQSNSRLGITFAARGVIAQEDCSEVNSQKHLGSLEVKFEKSVTKTLTKEECLYLRLAYSLSPRFAQTSKYNNLIIILNSRNLLSKRALYTLSTLADQHLVLVGHKTDLSEILGRGFGDVGRFNGVPFGAEGYE